MVLQSGMNRPKVGQYILELNEQEEDNTFTNALWDFLNALATELNLELRKGLVVLQLTHHKPVPELLNRNGEKDYAFFVGYEPNSKLYVYNSGGAAKTEITFTNGDLIIGNDKLISANAEYLNQNQIYEVLYASVKGEN